MDFSILAGENAGKAVKSGWVWCSTWAEFEEALGWSLAEESASEPVKVELPCPRNYGDAKSPRYYADILDDFANGLSEPKLSALVQAGYLKTGKSRLKAKSNPA